MSSYTRPTDKIVWTVTDPGTGPLADNDIANGPLGGNNVVAPTTVKQNTGWTFKEFPPRNWVNWLFRVVSKWIHWFDQQERAGGVLRVLGGLNHSAFQKTMTVGIGGAQSYDQTTKMNLPAGMGKVVINSAGNDWEPWVAGTGNGSVASAATAFGPDVTLYVFLLSDDNGENVDIGLDSNLLATSILTTSGLTKFRRIGVVVTRDLGGGVTELTQGSMLGSSGFFHYSTSIVDATSVSAGIGSPVSIPLTVPRGDEVFILAEVSVSASHPTANFNLKLSGAGGANEARLIAPLASPVYFQGPLQVDGSRNVEVEEMTAVSGSLISIWTRGFYDDRSVL